MLKVAKHVQHGTHMDGVRLDAVSDAVFLTVPHLASLFAGFHRPQNKGVVCTRFLRRSDKRMTKGHVVRFKYPGIHPRPPSTF